MLGGFSQGMLKNFLENRLSERATPLEQMRAILDSDYYDKVVVAREDLTCEAPRPELADVLFKQ